MILPAPTLAPLAAMRARVAYRSAVLATSGLLAYWRLGETSGTAAADSSGNGYAGTYSGTYTLNRPGLVAGDADAALGLAGAGYVDVTRGTLPQVDKFAVELWIKPSSVTATVMLFEDDFAAIGVLIDSSGVARARCSFGGVAVDVLGATSLVVGTRYHVAVTYDNARLRVYLNGIQDGSVVQTGTLAAQAGNPQIGRRRVNNDLMYAGDIDDVSFYSRDLTAAEVLDHYGHGA